MLASSCVLGHTTELIEPDQLTITVSLIIVLIVCHVLLRITSTNLSFTAQQNMQSFRRSVHYAKQENYPPPFSAIQSIQIIIQVIIYKLKGKPLTRNSMRSSQYAGKLLPNDLESSTRKTQKYIHVEQNIRGVKVRKFKNFHRKKPKF